MLKKFTVFCVFFAGVQAKSEESSKLEEALSLLQKATMLLREVEANLDQVQLTDDDYKRAVELVKEGKYEIARKILVPFSKGNSEKSLQSMFWIGYCFMCEKAHEKAIFAFVSFLNRSADFPSMSNLLTEMKKNANKNLVKCFEKLGRPADAIAILKRMETEFPDLKDYIAAELARLE